MVNSAVGDTQVQMSPQGGDVIFFGHIPREGIVASCLVFNFQELSHCLPQHLCQSTFPTEMYKGSLFSTALPILIFILYSNSLPDKCELIHTVVLISIYLRDDQ